MQNRVLKTLSPLAVLLVASSVQAADPPAVVEVPQPPPAKWIEVKAKPGRLLTINAGEKACKWAPGSDDFDLQPAADGKSAAFVAPRPGRYTVFVAAPDGDIARVAVNVGGDVPDPKKPDNTDPPAPDPLAGELRQLLDADGSATKGDDAKALAALYRLMAGEVTRRQPATPDNATPAFAWTNAEALNARYQTATRTLLGDAEGKLRKLSGVRTRAAKEIEAAAGGASDPLTDDDRKAIAAVFSRLAAAVEAAAR